MPAAQLLPFPATYPSGRQAFFAMRFQAHLFNSEAAIGLGSDAVVLLLSLIHISEPTRPCGTSRMPSSA